MNLIVKPHDITPGDSGELLSLSPSDAGWELVGFKVYRLQAGEYWSFENHGVESAVVLLGGRCDVTSNAGAWSDMGGRAHVFDGKPHALYLPLGAKYTISAKTPLEFAITTAKASAYHPARLIAPDDVEVEIRGDGNAKRQINKIIQPDFPADKLLHIVRTHWTIENQLHWVLDVVFDEDGARNRKDNGPQNIALLRKLALNLLRSHPDKASIRRKIKKAGWDDVFLLSILAQMR